jgi:hypothetical protein
LKDMQKLSEDFQEPLYVNTTEWFNLPNNKIKEKGFSEWIINTKY